MNQREYYVYIATNRLCTVLYIGVSNNLNRRMFKHSNRISEKSFTAKYNINKLVYYESFNSPEEAIYAEKKIKGWARKKKFDLIQGKNPNFRDLLSLGDSSLRPAELRSE